MDKLNFFVISSPDWRTRWQTKEQSNPRRSSPALEFLGCCRSNKSNSVANKV